MSSQTLNIRIFVLAGFVLSFVLGFSSDRISLLKIVGSKSSSIAVFDKYIRNGQVVGANEPGIRLTVVGVFNRATGQKCTGVTIGPKLVLTASHCVYVRNADSDIEIRFGVEFDRPVAKRFGQKVVIHEESSAYHMIRDGQEVSPPEHGREPYDVAFVQLDQKIPDGFVYSPYVLNRNAMHAIDYRTEFAIFGFGLPNFSKRSYDGRLRQASPAFSRVASEELIELSLAPWERSGSGAGITCPGDSGGPLFATRPINGKLYWVVAGINSTGGGECEFATYVSAAVISEFLKRHQYLNP